MQKSQGSGENNSDRWREARKRTGLKTGHYKSAEGEPKRASAGRKRRQAAALQEPAASRPLQECGRAAEASFGGEKAAASRRTPRAGWRPALRNEMAGFTPAALASEWVGKA